jgi:excisionase family DNA binding protein
MLRKSDLLTSKEAMHYLRVSPSKFWRMKAAGQIPVISFGAKSFRYSKADLDAVIAKHTSQDVYTREDAR